MPYFLEERLPACVRMGAEYTDFYNVEVTTDSVGNRYSRLLTNMPMRTFSVEYMRPRSELAMQVASLYHRVFGRFAGFRVKAFDDNTTAEDGISEPTAFDADLISLSTGSYQLVKQYGKGGIPLPGMGYPYRVLHKPVTGSALIAIAGSAVPESMYSVDYTTGIVTITDRTNSITAITKASSAVITVGTNTYSVGESVIISGVVGMTEINNIRAYITNRTASQITVNIDSTLFSDYVSGGTVQTRPLPAETVTGGTRFDIPCAFDSAFDVNSLTSEYRQTGNLLLTEILNP